MWNTVDDADFEGAGVGCGGRVEGFDEGWSDYHISLIREIKGTFDAGLETGLRSGHDGRGGEVLMW